MLATKRRRVLPFRFRLHDAVWAGVSAAAAAGWIQGARAYSFNIQTTPKQCENLTVSITGSDGSPPYRMLVIPFGTTPLANNIEARTLVEEEFSDSSVSFQLKYPANSQFVVVMSDSKSFGNGGTSAAATVGTSDDSSCFNSTVSVQPDFFFNIVPANQVVQCGSTRLWWDPATVQGTPTFYGVIPGGESFNITTGTITTVANQGQGFNWTANLRGGTTLMLGAGDDRGLNVGGSETYIVSNGLNPDSSCLNDQSPSSTAGSPAGGSYPTSTDAADNASSSGGRANAGAIAGGVVGGIAALAVIVLLVLFFRRRRRLHKHQRRDRPDLFTDADNEGAPPGEMQGLAAPEPYIVPPREPSEAGGSLLTSEWGGGGSSFPGSSYGYGVGTGAGGLQPTGYAGGSTTGRPSMSERDRRMSTISGSTGTGTGTGYDRPSTPQTSMTGTSASMGMRKSAAPPVMRPVNIIQHEDAGSPPMDDEQEPETVELPPAYTNIRPNA